MTTPDPAILTALWTRKGGSVRITHLDGKMPNLALMKISAHHKAAGDDVYFTRSPTRELFDHPTYAAVYGSAIFKFSADRVARFQTEWPGALVGGTGTDSQNTVEQIFGSDDIRPDYSIYPAFADSLGFTQRGCRLSCKFCVVPTKEGKARAVSTIADIWRGAGHPKHIHLLDNDFFGQPRDQWLARLDELRSGDFKVCLSQGINIRMVDDEAAQAIASVKYRDDSFSRRRLYTAWDNLKDEAVFFKGVETLAAYGIGPQFLMVYMLVGFDKLETWDRIWHRFNAMTALGVRPYPMVFDCRAKDPERYRQLKRFQRWVITGLYRSTPFAEYSTARDFGKEAA